MNKITAVRSGNRVARHCLGIFTLLVPLLIGGCDKAPKTQALPPLATVETMAAVQQDVDIHQEWIGTLDGMVNAQILAQVSGYLIKQHYQEGQRVKKGQLLYEIDPRILQASLDGARSNLARQQAVLKNARLDLERVQRLLPEKAVSVRDRDNAVGHEATAQAEVMVAKAAVERAELELGFTKITSPIDGIAGISKAQIGDLVGPGSANEVLTTISQVDPIKAYFPLSEQQYLYFARQKQLSSISQAENPLGLILADGLIYGHPGKFFFADRQVDVKTGTIQVAILFPNPDNLLRPGQFARVRAIVKRKLGAILVPQRAVSEMQGRQMVAVVKSDNTVELRPVKVGESLGNQSVIDEGLQAGEQVIVEGIQKIRPGSKVDPKPFAAISAPHGS